MANENSYSLWLEPQKHRDFLIPNNQRLLDVNCIIRQLKGIEKQVYPEAIAEFLTRTNYSMIIGNFELDFADGEIRYKTSIDVQGDFLRFELI